LMLDDKSPAIFRNAKLQMCIQVVVGVHNWCWRNLNIPGKFGRNSTEFLQHSRKESLDVPGYWYVLIRQHPWKCIPGRVSYVNKAITMESDPPL
jgi:hypothetical protein